MVRDVGRLTGQPTDAREEDLMGSSAEPFALVVRFTVRPGSETAFDELVASTTAAIRANEPGTLVYACHAVEGASRERIFYELYESKAAFQAHEDQEHTRHFLLAREALLESTLVDFLSLKDGKTPVEDH
jgi:quinol monooxygenase YgiN